ncbi:MAG: hypothetical protein LC800_17355 [Acidobacteria bacterium]|nr:hypothetical protein [Acidobacteriota bacterium]
MSPRTFASVVNNTARRASALPARAAAPRLARLILSASLALLCAACAAGSRDPEVTRPRADALPYPVVLAASGERRAGAAANWAALAGAQDPPPPPELQPVTSTVRALPADVPATLRLPLVELGAGEVADAEEATRESLRRFIATARDLLGVDPEDLSLVETQTEAGGARRVRYLQKPFPHPLRNGFGVVEIRFAPDRRVLSLASTAVPDAERITGALAALRPNLIPAADILARLAGRSFSYPAQNATQTFTLAAGDAVDVRELVVFPALRPADAAALEIRLAWEAIVGRGGTNLLVHIDAVTGETISAAQTTETPRPAPAATPTRTPAPNATPAITPPPTPPPPQGAPSPAPPAAAATPAPTPPATPPPARPKTP